MGAALRRPGAAAARRRPAARRPRRAVHAQPPALSGSAVGRLVGRAGGGAGQRQAAPGRSGMDHRQCRSALGLRHARRGAAAAGRSAAPGGGRIGRGRRAAGADGRTAAAGGAHARRPGLAVLHQRHHRPAQGRDADAAQPDDDGAGLLRRRRPDRAAGCDGLCGADVARLRHLRDPAPDGRRAPRRAGQRRRRPGRAVCAGPRARALVHLCRADHRQAPGRPCRGRGADAGRRRGCVQDHRLRRRADVPGRHRARAARDGPALRADLRPGRDADGGDRAVAPPRGRRRASAPARTPRLGGRGADAGARARGRRRGARARWARSARCWCAATP